MEITAIVRIIGRKYSQGVLTLDEAALLLGQSPSDVIFLFEENGFHRPVDVIRLSDEERAEILRQMRDDRLRRNGKPEYRKDQVARDVIASERIEGVDARPWIRNGS